MVYVYESKIYGVLGFDPFPHVQWSKYRVYIYIMYYILYIWGYGHPTIMIGIPMRSMSISQIFMLNDVDEP
jgi:hypothetical protein